MIEFSVGSNTGEYYEVNSTHTGENTLYPGFPGHLVDASIGGITGNGSDHRCFGRYGVEPLIVVASRNEKIS